MNDIEKLIEELNGLLEDELVDSFDDVEVEDAKLDNTSNPEPRDRTEELDAKTKISRALDVLVSAIDDFKNSTTEVIDLANDSTILSQIESLDDAIKGIQDSLDGKGELANPPEEIEDNEDEELEEVPEEDKSEEDKEDEEEFDFDDEASLDLFGNKDEE
jgi:hypothetical protein